MKAMLEAVEVEGGVMVVDVEMVISLGCFTVLCYAMQWR